MRAQAQKRAHDSQGNRGLTLAVNRDGVAVAGASRTHPALTELAFQALVEKALDGVLVAGDDRRVLEANPAACTMLGIERESLIGRRLDDLLLPASAHSVQQRWDQLLAAGHSRLEWQVREPSGETRVVEVSLVAEVVPGHHLAMLHDISGSKRDKAALHLRLKQQAAVAELGHRALAGEPIDNVFSHAVEFLTTHLETEFATLSELLPEGDALVIRAACGWEPDVRGRKFPATTETQAGYCLSVGEPVIVEDLSRETRFSGTLLAKKYGAVSGVSVPIPGRDRPFGTLCAHTRVQRLFTQDDINFVSSLANVLATVVERKRVEAEMQMQQETIRKLSTPVLRVRDRMLILPLIGPIDAKRARQISEQLLSGIRAARARAAVIDITGVGSMDEVAANSLVRTAEAARLLGAQVILTGISAAVARTLSMLPVDVSGVLTLGDLQSGIEEAEEIVESAARSLSAARQPRPLR